MITKKIRVYGIVQGVGFRPTVSRHAAAAGITGSVCNKGPYVEIFAQGEEKCVKDFLERLEKQPPKRAAILKINTEDVKEEEYGKFNDFQIIVPIMGQHIFHAHHGLRFSSTFKLG